MNLALIFHQIFVYFVRRQKFLLGRHYKFDQSSYAGIGKLDCKEIFSSLGKPHHYALPKLRRN